MTETVNRNAKNVCILVMLVINKFCQSSGWTFSQIKSDPETDHSRNPSYLLWFHYLPSSYSPASHQLDIFREDGVGVLRGPELRGAALQPHLPEAR